MSSADTVLAAGTELFVHRDPSAVDRYWARDYRQHSPLAPDGPAGLRGFAEHLPEDFAFEPLRVLDDGHLVAVHGVYRGLGPVPLVAFDVFRVADGRIAEHWDAMEPLLPGPDGTRPGVDGPTAVTERERTRTNKGVAAEWVETALIGGDPGAAADHVRTGGYVDHAPATEATPPAYRRLHRVVGEGNFALTVSEAAGEAAGELAGAVARYDLWRLENGRIAEHWGVAQPVPERMAHANGMF